LLAPLSVSCLDPIGRLKDPSYTYMHPSNPFDVTIAAPEVLETNHLSEKADIYSFGLVLWELRTRIKPFAGKNPHWVAQSVLKYA
jgi:serine/threonine protein kinase